MSATDHTIKLGLPLFRDDDKPTWRGDINDMSQRVDDGYGRLETDISTASNLASVAIADAREAKQAQDEVTEIAHQAQEAAEAAQTTIDGMGDRVDTAESTANRAIAIAQGAVAGNSVATIKHFNAFQGYDIIEIVGDDPMPFSKHYAKNHSDGIVPRADLETPKAFGNRMGYGCVIGADAFIGQNGESWSTGPVLAPVGLQITEGRAVQNFGVHAGDRVGSDKAAMIVYDSGETRIVYASDGKSAAEYVADGAWESFGYGPPLYRNGMPVAFDGSTYSGFAGVTGQCALARTQRGWVILIAYGVSNTQGMSVSNVISALEPYSPVNAILLDGGGSAQATWMGDLVHPSTDTAGERAVHSFIALECPLVNNYTSGEYSITANSNVMSGLYGKNPITVRQDGPLVTLSIQAKVNSVGNSWKNITDSMLVPRRMWPGDAWELMKGMVSGSQGYPIGVATQTDGGNLSVRCPLLSEDFSEMFCQGTIVWRAQYA